MVMPTYFVFQKPVSPFVPPQIKRVTNLNSKDFNSNKNSSFQTATEICPTHNVLTTPDNTMFLFASD